jgi:hypothetical protein
MTAAGGVWRRVAAGVPLYGVTRVIRHAARRMLGRGPWAMRALAGGR